MPFELDCEEYLDETMATSMVPDMDMELADEWYSSMLSQERIQHTYSPQRHYLKIRLILVDWMSDVGEELQLPKSVVHSAIAYLDRLLNTTSPLPEQSKLQLVCLCCILIAAKFGGVECEVPTMEEMHAYGHQQYSIDEIKSCEISILKALNWQLSILTPIHFTEFYLTSIPLYSDDEIHNCYLGDPNEYLGLFTKHVEFVAEMCIQEFAFQQWLPSVLATAIICVARRILNITPVWREEIESFTGYVVNEVEDCFHAMWSHYVHHFSKTVSHEPSPCSVGAYVHARA